MNLYLLTQNENNDYDTYDAIVVAAESEDQARLITPYDRGYYQSFGGWASPDKVAVELIGESVPGTEAGVILASFNAG